MVFLLPDNLFLCAAHGRKILSAPSIAPVSYTHLNQQNKAVIDYDKCKGCGRCIGACSFDAVYSPNECANEELDRKMAEYAAAVCHDRPCFHVALVQDISPNCDCHMENDAPIPVSYTHLVQVQNFICGGIAQLARAFGSYPKCHRFKSSCRYHVTEFR